VQSPGGAYSCKGSTGAWQAKHSLLLACRRRPARRLRAAQRSLPRCTKWHLIMLCNSG